MIRDQFMGLTNVADEFLREYSLRCTHCSQTLPTVVIDNYTGMFGDSYALIRYTLKDGRLAYEFLQRTMWFGGQVYFIGLRVSDGKRFLWTNDEMDNLTTVGM